MNVGGLISRIKVFIRQENFEPDTSRAMLAAVALTVPIAIYHLINKPGPGVFVGLTALLLTTAKWQGNYPQRALLILLGTLCISVAAFAGTLAGAYLLPAMLFMAIVAFFSSLARGLGDYGQTLGICAVILFLISLHEPNTLTTAFVRMQLVLIGGAWAAFLLLFYWPVSPNLPLFLKIGYPWELGSSLMQLIASSTITGAEEDDIFNKKNDTLRQALVNVFNLLRRQINGLTSIRRDLLKVNRLAYRFGATATALRDELANMPADIRHLHMITFVEQAAGSLSRSAKLVADAVITQRKKRLQTLQESIAQSKSVISNLHNSADIAALQRPARASVQHMVALLESGLHYLEDAFYLLNRMQTKQATRKQAQALVLKFNLRRWWQKTLLALQPNAMLLKHSQRVTIVAVLGFSLYYILELPRGYWIVLTIMVLLQPDFSTTKERTQDRLLGTMAGVVLGTVLLKYHLHFTLLMVAIAMCTFSFIYLQSRNYKLSVMFVTINLVAMLEVSEVIGWQIAAYRLLATLIGGMLAILAAYILWPRWESMQFPARMAKALKANKNYLSQIGHALQDKAGFHASVVSDQRKAEAENTNLLDTVKRLAQEPDSIRAKVKNAQKLAYYNNRLTKELNSFAAFLPSLKAGFDYTEAVEIIKELTQIIDDLATDAAQNKPVSRKPALETLFKRMETEMNEIKQMLQSNTDNIQVLEDMILNYELVYSLLDKIAHELAAMASLMNQETDVKPPASTSPAPVA